MSSLCAVAKSISAAAHRPSSWCGTIVNAAERRPSGKLAMTHFKSWSQATAIVGGSWERGSLSFLVDQMWVAWAFLHLRETRVLMSRFPVPSADMLVMFSLNRAVKGKIFFGIATNASCQGDITSALDGRPPREGTAAVAAVLSSRKVKAFVLNGKSFGPSVPPVKQIRGIVQFTLVERNVAVAVPGRPTVSTTTPTELAADGASFHFFMVLPSPLELDSVSVRPCWGRRFP